VSDTPLANARVQNTVELSSVFAFRNPWQTHFLLRTPVFVCVQAPQLPFWLLFLILSYGGKFSTKACLSLSLPRHSREGQIPNGSSIKSSSKTSDLNLRAARTC
jgi:hypothetical protein